MTDHKARLEFNKLQKRLRRNVGKAIADYNMIEDGDVIMACISGGKDSFAMLDVLLNLQKTAPVDFQVIAVNMDQKQPGFPEEVLPAYFEAIQVPYYIIDKDTYSVVRSKLEPGQKTCGLCSRLRRGTLYAFAESIGATKLALGHHMDDIVETLFLNMFHGSRMKGMPPKLRSDDQRNIVIRPLAYCREKDLIRYAEHKEFPIIPCNLCGSQENLQRQAIKEMLHGWEKADPGRVENIFKSMQNISPSQMAGTRLFDFANLLLERAGERAAYEFEDPIVSSTNLDTSLFINAVQIH